jgi:acyl carrier protein
MASTFEVDEDELNDSTSQKDIATWTSMAHLRLITNLEQALSLRFTMKEAAALTSYAEIEKTVLSKQG